MADRQGYERTLSAEMRSLGDEIDGIGMGGQRSAASDSVSPTTGESVLSALSDITGEPSRGVYQRNYLIINSLGGWRSRW
jgi:hypothetical protein